MAVLSADPRMRPQWRDAGRMFAAGLAWTLFATGWALGKVFRIVQTAVGGVLFGAGWLAAAVAWPALLWCGRATKLGWQEGRKPIGGQRGDS